MKLLRLSLLSLFLSLSWLPATSFAGFAEGVAAYNKGDFATALREWKPFADQGYANAQNNLGFMYKNGQGVVQDFKEAVRWYRLAADQGDANGQANLGRMYDKGEGVAQDFKEALRLYRLAAGQGNTVGQFNLGNCYDKGQGVPQDYKEAVRWFRLAANQGYAPAQVNLGVMYDNGEGVAQSKIVAYALYNLSAANDTTAANMATSHRASLAESLSTPEIEAAQDLTREMSKPNNFLKALDQYVKKPVIKEKPVAKPVAVNDDPGYEPTQTASNDPFPARPGKTPGVVSCNTRCVNAACWRTYDSGKKVKFQAKHVYDPLSSQWNFDSGNC